MKMRMPCCGAAIRAADPGQRGRARSLERDVESVLHPERFLAPAELARKFRATGFCLAAAVTGILLGGWQGLALADQPLTGRFNAAPREVAPAKPASAALSSEAVVRKFLEAEGAAAKAMFVKSPEHTQPLMESYFKKFGGGPTAEIASITCSSPGISAEYPSGPPVIHAVADLRDGSRQYFTLEETARGPLIDWTTSTGWSGVEFADLLARPGVSRRLHVLAHRDDYFPAPAGEASDLCLRIIDPRTGLPVGYAFTPLKSGEAAHLQSALMGGRRLVRLTLTLESDLALAPHRAVRVRAFHHTGFRAPESPSL